MARYNLSFTIELFFQHNLGTLHFKNDIKGIVELLALKSYSVVLKIMLSINF